MNRIITNASEIDFSVNDLPEMPKPSRVLMVKPTYYDVEYVINPHMKGFIGGVDKMQAQNEWEHLADGFEELGIKVITGDGVRDLPDMVFCANQCLPYIDEKGNLKALMGSMHSEQRKPEVPHIEKMIQNLGYETFPLDDNKGDFEGMGDAIWHFKRKLVWGGYGFRTTPDAYEQILNLFDANVILLELKDDYFYHLDTCFCSLNETSVLIFSQAFTDEGLEIIHKLYPTVIEATEYEAKKQFAVNAVCPDGRNVLIQQGNTDVNRKLRNHGFHVHEYSTYEFIKGGGSVFCMKLMLW